RYHNRINELMTKFPDIPIIQVLPANQEMEANSVFLAAAHAIIAFSADPDLLHTKFTMCGVIRYADFRDAGHGSFRLGLRPCFFAIQKALKCGFLNFNTFNLKEYEHYERVANGDLN